MRMLLKVKFPHEQFNQAVRDGSVGPKVRRILEDAKPEAVYFTEREWPARRNLDRRYG